MKLILSLKMDKIFGVKIKKFFEKYFGLGTAAEDANEYEYTNKENNEELRIVAEDKKDHKKD